MASKKIISGIRLVQSAPLLIFIAISIGVVGDFQNVVKAYKGFSSKQEMIQANWREGFSSSKVMIFEQREDPIVGGLLRPAGTYQMSNDIDWGVAAIMRFHGKEAIQIISHPSN